MRSLPFRLATTLLALAAAAPASALRAADTAFANPVIWADYPDPSVIRVGDTFYMVSTTMFFMPGGPILKSTDLVHWELASYVFDRLTDSPQYDLAHGTTAYGRGQWATSIRYHDGHFYVLFSPNDAPYRAYLYRATDAAGPWELVSRLPHFHDASLFFDDDGRTWVFSGTGALRELKADLSDAAGPAIQIFERDASETGLLEGSHVVKHQGKYYLLMISWPRDGKRRQVCYRADTITGPYEKQVIIEAAFGGFPPIGQGQIVEAPDGSWYGIIFQDRGGVGRVPLLLPVRWQDGWPMLGDAQGQVPARGTVPFAPGTPTAPLTTADTFATPHLAPQWQWNHNPIDTAWSLTERPGYLRLRTNWIVDSLYAARNTLTQRLEGPRSQATVALDVAHLQDGDVAGLAAFNGHSGVLAVVREGDRLFLTQSAQLVHLDKVKTITGVDVEEKARVALTQPRVFLRLDADFRPGSDVATFAYSLDNQTWHPIGEPFKMRFDYTRLFIGTRLAIFNYATKLPGGYVDVDSFAYRVGEE